MTRTVRIATRQSALALWQARHVSGLLQRADPELDVQLLPMTTRGDRLLETPLAQIGGKGLFLKELERAMLDGEADLAVHSMKDVPVEMTEGLTVCSVLERANPCDAWLSQEGLGVDDLPAGAIVGTSSLRRQSQLLARRPDVQVKSLRGNVDTRLKKLQDGDYDAIILAVAGLQRLGLGAAITDQLAAPDWLPAPCQGAIGLQCRSDDDSTIRLLQRLNHPATSQRVKAERAVSLELGGSCQLPLAAYAEHGAGDELVLHAMVGSSDGRQILRARCSGSAGRPEEVAHGAAQTLLAQGAEAIMRAEALGAGQ